MGATAAMHGMQYGNFAAKIHSYLHIDQSRKSQPMHLAFWLAGRPTSCVSAAAAEGISALLARHPQLTQLQQLNLQERHQLLEAWLAFIQLQSGSGLYAVFLSAGPKAAAPARPSAADAASGLFRMVCEQLRITGKITGRPSASWTAPPPFLSVSNPELYPAEGQKIIAGSAAQSTAVLFKKSGACAPAERTAEIQQGNRRFLKRDQTSGFAIPII